MATQVFVVDTKETDLIAVATTSVVFIESSVSI
jgi:hypothetical protein